MLPARFVWAFSPNAAFFNHKQVMNIQTFGRWYFQPMSKEAFEHSPFSEDKGVFSFTYFCIVFEGMCFLSAPGYQAVQ